MLINDTYQVLLDSANNYDRQKITIFTALSGGVDSSVVAYLLKKEGFNVRGIYMQCHGKNDPKCRAHKDRSDAIKVASYLDIPIEIWDLEEEYKNLVIEYFYKEYYEGRTPNPDILCNSKIKFDLFLNKALQLGADYVATGHYAKILQVLKLKVESEKFLTQQSSKVGLDSSILDRVSVNNYASNSPSKSISPYTIYNIPHTFFLASGFDVWKDQSYFLSKVNKDILNKIIFPLGSAVKGSKSSQNSTRKIALKAGIPVANKKDSTGICFLEGVVVQDFLKKRFKEKTGNVLNKKGEIIGTHKGAYFYTVGQRKDFEISKYHGKPLYVLSKNIKNNTIIVGLKKSLQKSTIGLKDCDFRFSVEELTKIIDGGQLYVRIRNLGEFVKIASVTIAPEKTIIKLSKSLESIAPGQFAVLYYFEPKSGERLIVGSGVIA